MHRAALAPWHHQRFTDRRETREGLGRRVGLVLGGVQAACDLDRTPCLFVATKSDLPKVPQVRPCDRERGAVWGRRPFMPSVFPLLFRAVPNSALFSVGLGSASASTFSRTSTAGASS